MKPEDAMKEAERAHPHLEIAVALCINNPRLLYLVEQKMPICKSYTERVALELLKGCMTQDLTTRATINFYAKRENQ